MAPSTLTSQAASSRTLPPTATVEDYLKSILQSGGGTERQLVSTGHLAVTLGLAPSTVTAMVKTLADRDLLIHEPYAGVRLTPPGWRLATRVLRRHRLLELFLVEVMDLDWGEVHAEAEALEHAVSDRLIDRIDEMLGRPTVDPHGDPIPSAAGELEEPTYDDLLACPLGEALKVVRILDQRAPFLEFVQGLALAPGAPLTVDHRDAAGEILRIRVAGSETPIVLGSGAAAKILVRPRVPLPNTAHTKAPKA